MKRSLHYSPFARDLLLADKIEVDVWKCPAWPDTVNEAAETRPVYVHFPLKAGLGTGHPIDTETGQPVEWHKIESLLTTTVTRYINIHLCPNVDDFPEIAQNTRDSSAIEQIIANLIRDVTALIDRFGAENIIIENDHDGQGRILQPAFLPSTITRVAEETNCGILLDLAHATLASAWLQIDAKAYLSQLPLERVREMHLSGVRRVEGEWLALLQSLDYPSLLERWAGRLLDHLPMTERDWHLFAWSHKQMAQSPWLAGLEFGGVGKSWSLFNREEWIVPQMERLKKEICWD